MFEVSKPEFINKTFRLEKSLVDELTQCAATHGVSVNALVAQCCSYALSHMSSEEIENNE